MHPDHRALLCIMPLLVVESTLAALMRIIWTRVLFPTTSTRPDMLLQATGLPTKPPTINPTLCMCPGYGGVGLSQRTKLITSENVVFSFTHYNHCFLFLYQILSNKMTFLIEIWKRELYICLVQNLFCFSPDKGRDALPSTLNLQFRPDRVGFPFTDRIRFLSLLSFQTIRTH